MVNISEKLTKEYSCYSAYKNSIEVFNAWYNPFDFIARTEKNEDINFICRHCKIRQQHMKSILSTMNPKGEVSCINNFGKYFELADFYDPAGSHYNIEIICRSFLNYCLKCKK